MGTLGALGAYAARIAKAIQDFKANRKHLEEQKCHNIFKEQATTGKRVI